jgi:hypothetical protein
MTIPRVVIKDYKAFGEKIIHWVLHPSSKPKDLHEFKHQTHGIVEVPDRIKELEFYDSGDLSELVIKLPNRQMVEESLQRFKDPHAKYPVPPFYFDKVCEDHMPNLDFLRSRIADYTIAQCM